MQLLKEPAFDVNVNYFSIEVEEWFAQTGQRLPDRGFNKNSQNIPDFVASALTIHFCKLSHSTATNMLLRYGECLASI